MNTDDNRLTPQSDVPQSDVPQSDVPQLDVPQLDVPQLDVPQLDVPQLDVPQLDVPQLDVPQLDVPQLDVPQLDVPLSAAEKALFDYARESLDNEVAGLDPAVVARLKRARQQALSGQARTPRARRRQNHRWWWPAGGLVTAVAAGLAVIILSPGPQLPNVPVLTDLEILASAEGVVFYEELEFYLWLAEQVDAS